MEKKVAVITGCSTGIGRELCGVLARNGYDVVATARDVGSIADVPAALRLRVDVTDGDSIREAVREIDARFGRIDALVNNAGVSVRGAVEEVDATAVRNMFEVNVFGVLNVTREVLPVMRKGSRGRIVNVGSISGRFAQPINGAYCASKHSVEAISDALRYELRDQAIQVTVVEPGPVRTDFFATMEKNSGAVLTNGVSPYRDLYRRNGQRVSEQKYAPPLAVAERIRRILAQDRMKARYQIAVPLPFRMIVAMPAFAREYLMTRG